MKATSVTKKFEPSSAYSVRILKYEYNINKWLHACKGVVVYYVKCLTELCSRFSRVIGRWQNNNITTIIIIIRRTAGGPPARRSTRVTIARISQFCSAEGGEETHHDERVVGEVCVRVWWPRQSRHVRPSNRRRRSADSPDKERRVPVAQIVVHII